MGIEGPSMSKSCHFKKQPPCIGEPHKLGICVPCSIKEAIKLDDENGKHLWNDAIKKEMAKAAVLTPLWKG